MVVGYIAREIFRQAFKGLYRAVNFQDKAINQAWSAARFNRPVRLGVRHGAGIGAATGYFISNEFQDDIEDYGFTSPKQPVPASRKYGKARNRQTKRNNRCYPRQERYRYR